MLTKAQRIEEIKKKGFELVDDHLYQNRKSRIVVKCPKGHLVETCIEDFRKVSFECPKCAAQEIKPIKTTVVPPKEKGMYRIVAFDQATEHFGISIFDNGKLSFYSLYNFSGTLGSRLVQITKMVRDVIIPIWQPDFVCFEDIQYEHGVLTFKTLAELVGIITEILEEKHIDYEIVSPNVWRKYAGTAGKTRREEKLLSIGRVKELFSITVPDDIAEAILIGRYAAKVHFKKLF